MYALVPLKNPLQFYPAVLLLVEVNCPSMQVVHDSTYTPGERRAKRRFLMEREVRFRVLEQDHIIAVGRGMTFDLSSNGVAFVAESELPSGAFIEMSIAWPTLLENSCPLQLIGFGRVLRSSQGKTVSTIEQYEFRTSARLTEDWSARSDQKLRRWAETAGRA